MENRPAQQPMRSSVVVASGTYVADDQDALRVFMRQLQASPLSTERAFRKAVSCFLVWLMESGHPPGRSLPAVNVADIEDYFRFLRSRTPLPKAANEGVGFWKGPAPLAAASLKHAKTLLATFFDKLCDYEASPGVPFRTTNPVRAAGRVTAARREPRKPGETAAIDQDTAAEKILPLEDIELILTSIEAMPKETDRQRFHYHRARWVFILAYRSFLRLSELARLQMGDFRFERTGDWRLYVHPSKHESKGVLIDVFPDILEALTIYRRSLGMIAHPLSGEPHAAILHISKKKIDAPPVVTALKLRNGEPSGAFRVEPSSASFKPLSERAIFDILANVFANAAKAATTPWQSGRLLEASPHWLRHSGITHALNAGMDPRYVAAQARHKDLKTTFKIYDHGLEPAERRKETAKLKRIAAPSSSSG